MRGVTSSSFAIVLVMLVFQLTRLMRGVTANVPLISPKGDISTHTPHARRDRSFNSDFLMMNVFQLTRLLRGVTALLSNNSCCPEFQLTRLMRGVTAAIVCPKQLARNFNSHASCEA